MRPKRCSTPVSDIEGFMLACLVDASTGMVLASRKDQDDISLPTAAAGAADIANVLSQRRASFRWTASRT
jgi:hypothetical protein